MKILTKYRILAAKEKTLDVDILYDLYKEDEEDENEEYYDLIEDYDIKSSDLIRFVHKHNVLESLARYWINEEHGFTGNFLYEIDEYFDDNDYTYNVKRNPILFIGWLLEHASHRGNVKTAFNLLQKEYINLAKTKYRKYVYPVLNTRIYDQVFPEFKDFNPRDPDIKKCYEKYNEGYCTDLRVFEDYVKSTGFR